MIEPVRPAAVDARYLAHLKNISTWPAFARISPFHPLTSFPFPLPFTAVQMGMKPLRRSCSASLSFRSSCLPNIAKTATGISVPLGQNLILKANIVDWYHLNLFISSHSSPPPRILISARRSNQRDLRTFEALGTSINRKHNDKHTRNSP